MHLKVGALNAMDIYFQCVVFSISLDGWHDATVTAAPFARSYAFAGKLFAGSFGICFSMERRKQRSGPHI